MVTLQIRTPAHSSAVDITGRVAAALRNESAKSGICLIYCPHTTAGLIINEGADPSVMEDVLNTLDALVPWRGNYKHSEGNSAAHVKSILVGGSLEVIVDAGGLVLGTWQKIFLLEFDGPRTRNIFVKFLGDSTAG